MPLLYSRSESVGRMTFDFPEKKNALDQDARKEMERIVTQVRDDDRVRALLITGAGARFAPEVTSTLSPVLRLWPCGTA